MFILCIYAISLLIISISVFIELSPWLVTPFAVVVTFFLPGYVMLGILKLKIGPLAELVSAFLLSYLGDVPILLLAKALPVNPKVAFTFIYLPLFFIVTFFSLKKHVKNEHVIVDLNRLIMFIITLSMMCISLSLLYPDMLKVSNLDIVRHYRNAVNYAENLDYYKSIYPLFYIPESIVILWTGASSAVLNTTLSFLSLLLPISYYLFVKEIVDDSEIAALSSLLFITFSGFGWLLLVRRLVLGVPLSEAVRGLAEKTYWDIGYGMTAYIWLWFRPMTVGMIGFFITLSLLSRQEKTVPFILIVLAFTHLPELVFTIFLIFIFSIFSNKYDKLFLKIKNKILLILLIISLLYCLRYFIPISKDTWYMKTKITILLLFTLIIIQSFLHKFLYNILYIKIRKRINILKFRLINIFSYLLILLMSIYLGIITWWIVNPDIFSLKESVGRYIYEVPIYMYPVLLGLTPVLSLLSLVKVKFNKEFILFITASLFFLLLAKTIVIVYLVFFTVFYFERRIITLIFITLLPLTALYIKNLLSKKGLLYKLILLLIVAAGGISTFLTVSYWYIGLRLL